MKRLLCLLLTVFLLLAGFCPAALANAAYDLTQGDYVPGEAVVLYDASVIPSTASTASTFSTFSADSQVQNATSPDFGAGIAVQSTLDFALPQKRGARGGTEEPGLHIAHVSSTMDTQTLLNTLNALPGVVAAEPNYAYTTAAVDDPYYYALQWGLSRANGIHADELWDDIGAGAEPVIIAVVDSGVDYDHPDLAGRLTDPSMAFDAYPYINNRTKLGQEINTSGHGTMVAGIIAAVTNNGIGVAGVAGTTPVEIMPVQVFANNTTAYLSDIVAGLHHVLQQKSSVNVVAANMSLGSSWHSSVVTSYALEKLSAAGILPVRSAGNDGQYINEHSVYPSIYEAPGVVGVAAIQSDGSFDGDFVASYSNYSTDCIQIAAPGAKVVSTNLTYVNGYLDTTAVGRAGCDPFEDFNNIDTYDLTIQSNGIVQHLTLPTVDGGRSGKCLRLEFPNARATQDYRVTLPAFTPVEADKTLGLQLRVMCSVGNTVSFSIGDTPIGGRTWSMASDGVWVGLSGRSTAQSGDSSPMHLWLRPEKDGPFTVFIDDVGVSDMRYAAYTAPYRSYGTSLAAPHVAGAYGLLCMARPYMIFAERRARLIGSVRTHPTLADKVNAGGSLDLTHTLDTDTAGFCPVIDSITQSGDTVTVEGWFFGNDPTLSLAGRSIPVTSRTGSEGACTLTFTLPPDISDVQTLTLTKDNGNGRSYRMRYRYDADGNMQEVCDGPAGNIRTVLFAQGEQLYALGSTADGFVVHRLAGNSWEPVAALSNDPRTARTDFTYCVADGTLYIYDYNHVHSLDLSTMKWSTINGPDALQPSDRGYAVGAIAMYKGRLMILGGSTYVDPNRTRVYRSAPSVYESGKWVDDPPLPVGKTLNAAQAVEVDGTLLVFAKHVTNTWPVKTLPYVLRYDGASWHVRDAAYDVTGCTLAAFRGTVLCFGDGNAQQGILRYDPAREWSRLPYWGTGLPYTAVGAVAGESLYVLTALQEYTRFILQTVKPPLPVPAPPAESPGDPFFVQATPTPTPTPTPTLIPVADVPRTGGAHRLWLIMPLLALLPLFWRYMERKRP